MESNAAMTFSQIRYEVHEGMAHQQISGSSNLRVIGYTHLYKTIALAV